MDDHADAGAPWIRAGDPDDGPPDEAYSRVTDPDRYLTLHTVADRVVADLVARFDVAAEPVAIEGPWRGGVLRATALRPAGEGAPLVVIVTGFGVVLRAGHAFELGLPSCGCDACDEDPADLARALTEAVERVTGGALVETRPHGRGPFTVPARVARGWGRRSHTIAAGTTEWPAWPPRP